MRVKSIGCLPHNINRLIKHQFLIEPNLIKRQFGKPITMK